VLVLLLAGVPVLHYLAMQRESDLRCFFGVRKPDLDDLPVFPVSPLIAGALPALRYVRMKRVALPWTAWTCCIADGEENGLGVQAGVLPRAVGRRTDGVQPPRTPHRFCLGVTARYLAVRVWLVLRLWTLFIRYGFSAYRGLRLLPRVSSATPSHLNHILWYVLLFSSSGRFSVLLRAFCHLLFDALCISLTSVRYALFLLTLYETTLLVVVLDDMLLFFFFFFFFFFVSF